jgi:hypothetical protein
LVDVGLWGNLPLPTITVPFDRRRLDEITAALEAHEQELERNDYRRLVRGRAEMNAARGPELVFGFGSPGDRRPTSSFSPRRCSKTVAGCSEPHADSIPPPL